VKERNEFLDKQMYKANQSRRKMDGKERGLSKRTLFKGGKMRLQKMKEN
jgi:hypothetical protein